MNEDTEPKLYSIIKAYETLVKGIDKVAHDSLDRAYGGIVRAGKGKLVESIGKELVKIAWVELGEDMKRLSFVNKTIKIPLKKDYLNRIKDSEVRNYIEKNLQRMYYRIKPDIQVAIDGKFKISIECKAYTENAMLKRILVDCTLLKNVYPDVSFVLLQLESQLGGDYSFSITGKYGSPPTHTLLSYFDVDLNIITLLKGERKVDQPIHKPEYYKPLEVERLNEAVEIFKDLLQKIV
jgi:hypothetical protein